MEGAVKEVADGVGGRKRRRVRELEEGCGTWKWGREVNIYWLGVITSFPHFLECGHPRKLCHLNAD